MEVSIGNFFWGPKYWALNLGSVGGVWKLKRAGGSTPGFPKGIKWRCGRNSCPNPSAWMGRERDLRPLPFG